jgi:hypothetical protein
VECLGCLTPRLIFPKGSSTANNSVGAATATTPPSPHDMAKEGPWLRRPAKLGLLTSTSPIFSLVSLC